MFCDRFLVRKSSLVTVRFTHLAQATESFVFGTDDDLVNVNIASVTQSDSEVGVFGVVVELGGTHNG